MAFFTQAINDGTIDKNLEMSEEELRNAIIASIRESNAFEKHKRLHKDAQLSTISEEGGFSEIEKHAGKKHEDVPAISYNSHTKNFVASCNCGKEKFVFDIKSGTVEIENTPVHMKEMDPYKKDNQKDGYGREQSENSNTYNGPQRAHSDGYSNNSGYSQSGMKYKN